MNMTDDHALARATHLLPDIEDAEKPIPLKVEIPYSFQMAEFIITNIFEQKRLSDIAGKNGIPSLSTIFGWMRKHPDFKEAYEVALKAQALLAAEDIIEMSRYADGLLKDEVPAHKLKFEVLKFIAERNDKERYASAPPKQEQNSGATIVINTGVTKNPNDTRTVEDLVVEMKKSHEGFK